MFQHSTIEVARAFCFAFLLVIPSPIQADDLCTAAAPVDLGASLRTTADAGELSIFRLEVPSAGILSVDVTVPGLASEPGLSLAHGACAASEPLVIERSASHMVVAVDGAGDHVFRVASPDPRDPLSDLKLRSAFVGDPWGTPDGYDEDEEEIEIEADPLIGDPWGTPDGYDEDEEEIEIEADPFVGDPWGTPDGYDEDEEEIEIEADPFTGGMHYFTKDGEDEEEIEIDGFFSQLCGQGEVDDDHSDSFICATWLESDRMVAGELGNGWGDDTDTFQFVLDGRPDDDLWAVVIEAVSEVGTAAALYDRNGQRLDMAGSVDGFRIVRTLSPGTYYVRVVGRDSSEGRYRISVDVSR